MILYFVLAGLALILALAVLKPKLFATVKESIAGAWFMGVTGMVSGLYEYFRADDSWHELVDPSILPWFLLGIGIFGVVLRNINVGSDR